MPCVGELVSFPSEPAFDRRDRTDKRQMGKPSRREGGNAKDQTVRQSDSTCKLLDGHGRAWVVLTFLLGFPTPSAAETMGPTYSWLLALMIKSNIRKIWPVSGWAHVSSPNLRIRNEITETSPCTLKWGWAHRRRVAYKVIFLLPWGTHPHAYVRLKTEGESSTRVYGRSCSVDGICSEPSANTSSKNRGEFFPVNGFHHSVSGKLFHGKKMPRHFQQHWKK